MEENKNYPGLKDVMPEKKPLEWDLFKSKYFKLEEGEQARLVITGWHTERDYKYKEDQREGRPALIMEVVSENGEFIKYKKYWITSSQKTTEMIKPFIVEAEKIGARTINVLVVKQGKTYLVYP